MNALFQLMILSGPRHTRPGRLLSTIAVSLLVHAPHAARAHEGHAALPTKGLTVQGDQLLLSEGARQAIDLQTKKVVLTDMQRLVNCNAHVELPWQQQSMVTTQVPGKIARVAVRPGDAVKAGQELATVESLELESLQLSMLQADAELTLAQEQLARQESLASQGVIAGSAALETETTVLQRRAELEIAMCKLRALGIAPAILQQVRQTQRPVTYYLIISPISGVVGEADVRVGQVVKTTDHLFHIVDLSTVWVVGDVLESEVADVQPGQPAEIRIKSLPERVFSGRIDHLHMKMNDKRRTRAVAVAVENPEGLLRPGMFGQMEIEVARLQEAIVSPTEAIIRFLGSEYVLLNRGEGKYIRQPVEIGIRHEDQVEILDGLFPGDQVVVNGNHVLFSLFASAAPEATSASANDAAAPRQAELEQSVQSDDQPLHDLVVVQGTVELPTAQKAMATSRIEGRVARILVSHSQTIQAGQVLAEVESLQLRNLQSGLLESQAQLIWTSERVARLRTIAAQNITSKKELWQLETSQRVLENRVASARRRLAMIGVAESEVDRILQTDLSAEDCDAALLRSVPIRAPINGKVAEFTIAPGQIVNSENTLFEIHDASTVWVKGCLFQRDATKVQLGQPVELSFHALPDVSVTGTIVRVAPVLDASERVLPVWVEVDNFDGRLIEGMLARMVINTQVSSVAVAGESAPQR